MGSPALRKREGVHSCLQALQPSVHPSPSLRAHSQVLPKREGLLHVSEWGPSRVNNVADVVKEGDTVDVMVTEVQVSTRVRTGGLLAAVLSWDVGDVVTAGNTVTGV